MRIITGILRLVKKAIGDRNVVRAKRQSDEHRRSADPSLIVLAIVALVVIVALLS